MKYPSTDELLKPEATLILDTAPLSAAMVARYPYSFKQPEEGIYLVGSLKPIVKLSKLRTERGYINHTAEEALKELLENGVLGDVILNRRQRRYSKQWFSVRPPEALAASDFICTLVDFELASQCPWAFVGVKERRIYQSLSEKGVALYEDGVFDLMVGRLVSTAVEFIKPEQFKMYDVRRLGTSMAIERLCDWRVYEWTKAQEELANAAATGLDDNPY